MAIYRLNKAFTAQAVCCPFSFDKEQFLQVRRSLRVSEPTCANSDGKAAAVLSKINWPTFQFDLSCRRRLVIVAMTEPCPQAPNYGTQSISCGRELWQFVNSSSWSHTY